MCDHNRSRQNAEDPMLSVGPGHNDTFYALMKEAESEAQHSTSLNKTSPGRVLSTAATVKTRDRD